VQSTIQISTVTPVYNGSKYLPDLVIAIDKVRNLLSEHTTDLSIVESIFVIDDAIDNSAEVLAGLAKQHSWVKIITISRNYGQHPATIAGLLHTSGDWVATLDEDLQHKPIDIVKLLKKAVAENADISYAASETVVHRSWMKDFASATFKRIVSSLVGNPHIKDFCSFRLIRGNIARATAAICRHETYLDVALGWFTRRIVTTPVTLHDDRNQSGEEESGYSVWSLVRHGKRMIMSSKLKVFRVGIFLGIFAFGVSILLSLYTIVSVLLKMETVLHKGWASTILAVIFFGGLSILLTAIVLESISDIGLNLNGKPTYFVVDRSQDPQILASIEKLEKDVDL